LRKVIIFGNSGSGKSTLAKEISEAENLAHLDLDTLAWLPSVPPARTPINEINATIQLFIKSNSSWVIEGCYTDLLTLVSPLANEIIFMDVGIEQCVENARQRPWESHKYPSKQAQDDNLGMLISWIEDYKNRDDTFSYQAHCAFYENFSGNKIKYLNNERDSS
jgi:adenylate kinase family enzyme